jgi:ATP-dependent Zn protease
LKAGVAIRAAKEDGPSLLMQIFISWFPLLLLIGVWIFFMRQMQGGGGRGALSFGKSKARLLTEDKNNITFADVAGVDEAKEEVQELVEFLSDPSRFQKLGGRIPRGVLMTGSPPRARHCWRKRLPVKPRFRFSLFPVRTLLRCSWGWGPPEFATCLIRLRKTRRASSSSMRLMR